MDLNRPNGLDSGFMCVFVSCCGVIKLRKLSSLPGQISDFNFAGDSYSNFSHEQCSGQQKKWFDSSTQEQKQAILWNYESHDTERPRTSFLKVHIGKKVVVKATILCFTTPAKWLAISISFRSPWELYYYIISPSLELAEGLIAS